MPYLYDLPNSTSGIDQIVIDTFNVFPFFGSLFLLFIWFVIFLGGITRQTLRSGTADYSAWAVIASVATLLPTLLMSVSTGFIQVDWLVIVVTLNIATGVWFFLDKKSSEV